MPEDSRRKMKEDGHQELEMKGRITEIKLVLEKPRIPQLHRSPFPLHFFLSFRSGRQRYTGAGGNRSVSILLIADKSHLMRLMNEQIPHSHSRSGGGVCI